MACSAVSTICGEVYNNVKTLYHVSEKLIGSYAESAALDVSPDSLLLAHHLLFLGCHKLGPLPDCCHNVESILLPQCFEHVTCIEEY
jgi:hypothetical protein